MKRFQFRLEKILNLRRYREREWEQKLAVISGICIGLENRIEMLKREKERVAFRYVVGTNMDVSTLVSRELYTLRINKGIEELEEELEKRREELEEVRKKYLEVSKERKVLEKLKERQESKYYYEQKLEDIKVVDDLNNAKTNRDSELFL